MGNCFTQRGEEFNFCYDQKRPESSLKSVNESMRRAFPIGVDRKMNKTKALSQEDTTDATQSFTQVSFNLIDKIKSENDINIIKEALLKNFLFSSLSSDHQDSIIKEMKYLEAPSNQYLMIQGQLNSYFLVLASGRAELIENGKRINIIQQKDFIGEIALINDTPRPSSVRTLQHSSFWALDRKSFRTIIQTINSAEYSQDKILIESVPIFSILSKTQREMLLTSARKLKYTNGQIIAIENEPGNLFILIKEGIVECKRQGQNIRTMGVGDYFGDQSLLYGSMNTTTIIAISEVKCLGISKNDISDELVDQMTQVVYKNTLRGAFEKSKIFNNLDEGQIDAMMEKISVVSWDEDRIVIKKTTPENKDLYVTVNGKIDDSSENYWKVMSILGEEDATYASELLKTLKKITLFRGLCDEKLKILIDNLHIEQYEQGKVIFHQNSLGEAFYIIKQGKVDVIRDELLIRSINKFDYFGERSLLFNELRSATVKAHDMVQLWVLKKADFLHIVDERMQVLMQKRIALQDTSVKIDDLIILKQLGTGMLGNVFLTCSVNTKQLYALKVIDRNKIENEKVQNSLMLERKILLQLDHSFILKLIKTFKDEKRVYFLLEYVRGEDLFDVIRDIGLLCDEDTKFYACCLLIILHHLHERDIVYRDLKPENVMVDEEGYLKLIDFGTSKIINGRTYTMIGTPHYMAPEIILGKGYNVSADYWSLGIMLYEFLCGGVPFAEDSMDTYAIFQRILEGKINYPLYANPMMETRSFIELLLNKNPASRCGGGWEKLKSHQWLKDYDWDGLIEKRNFAPHVPLLPNLDWEIEKAFVNQKKINTILTVEDSVIGSPRRIIKRVDWDSEF
ncbi:hypothetical protein SteCoe_8642 [Stentor coeruleus]|uniref:cGMP-dependent protein kinase n=1 Tax=Stentor coeruleus TaxID=5963 RepID=A0A1R2CJP1_9CILI|nr:hypothetical protein SteCoe_8642 [Stentor coeruleus]